MIKDLCIKEILNAYSHYTANWQRNRPIARAQEGAVLFTEGTIEYSFPDRSFEACAGDLLLLPKDIPYSGMLKSKKVAYFCLDFELSSDAPFYEIGAPAALPLANFDFVCESFSSVVFAWEEQRIDAAFRAKAFLYTLFSDLLLQNVNSSARADDLIGYICDHYGDSDLSVAGLCREFYISESQLRRKILQKTGLTPNEYITSLRINRAKRELVCAQKSIGEIARVCGFASTYYFSRCFHAHVGLSPREYRAGNLML